MMVIRRGFGPSCTDGEIAIFQLVLPYLDFTILAEIRCLVSVLIVLPIANNLMKGCFLFRKNDKCLSRCVVFLSGLLLY